MPGTFTPKGNQNPPLPIENTVQRKDLLIPKTQEVADTWEPTTRERKEIPDDMRAWI